MNDPAHRHTDAENPTTPDAAPVLNDAGPVVPARDRERGVRWLLSASAVMLAGLLAWSAQAMQLGRDGGAGSGMVSNVGDYTMMTFSAGNEDMLITLDNRSEELYVYRVENQNAVALFQKLSLPRLFSEARTRAQGSSK
ncbi:MAG: hypothetical protein IT434_11970 [Phycisphaerales bacterium]|jgi:hypothetical protein|nr:hypothetical protein [Phycisphaerales bacterium]